MAQDTYLVLRITAADWGAVDLLTTPDWRSSTAPVAPQAVEYRVDAQPLDPEAYRALRRDRQVAAIARPMPLTLIRPAAAPEPAAEPAPVHGATWGVFVTGALQSPYVGHGVTVAVLDTGIDAAHEAFRGIELVQRDFTGEGDGDQDGHGTHVAGTIFGQTVQGVRYGVAPGVRRALIGKVLGTQHTATTLELVDAVHWAVEEGARSSTCRWRSTSPVWSAGGWSRAWRWTSPPHERWPSTATTCASSTAWSTCCAPALPSSRARSSSRPPATRVGAPSGPTMLSRWRRPPPPTGSWPWRPADCRPTPRRLDGGAVLQHPSGRRRAGRGGVLGPAGGGYTAMDGTSMASPHVAGVAALWAERQLQRNGTVNISTLDAQLRGNARRDWLPGANALDVGEGLVTAPKD